MNILLVMTNLPTQEVAESLASRLVEQRLAACVNILPSCRSVYQWKGEVERTEEVPLLIKTSEARYPALEEAIRSVHPYDTPEIIAIPVTRALPGYLAWVEAETQVDNWLSP